MTENDNVQSILLHEDAMLRYGILKPVDNNGLHLYIYLSFFAAVIHSDRIIKIVTGIVAIHLQ